MQRVPFGKLGFDVSRLGFGAMRLPTRKEGDKDVVDRPEAIKMIRHAIDSGVTYVDTAYGYHGGDSERVVGEALKDGYREKVLLTSKLPQWNVQEPGDMEKLLTEQLDKLKVDHLDFYLLHAMNRDAYKKLRGFGCREFLAKAKKDGRIRHAGFSFHDDAQTFREILDDNDWDAAQIQFNYLDDENQATLDGLRYAGKKGVPLIVMEPLRGGTLANPVPEVKTLMKDSGKSWNPAEWAFRYVADFPEVAVILSGMSTMEQVNDNLRIFESAKADGLTDAERAIIASFKQAYLSRMPIGCTHCNYCQPCPQGVDIPEVFSHYNEGYMMDNLRGSLWGYNKMIEDKADASRCVACGRCEGLCPQQLKIIDWLKKVDGEFKALK